MTLDAKTILTVTPICQWFKFNDQKSVIFINNEEGNIADRFFVDNNVVKVLNGINGKRSIEMLLDHLNETYYWNISLTNLIDILKSSLLGKGFFVGEPAISQQERLNFSEKYIKFKTKVFSATLARKISSVFVGLFNVRTFCVLFATSLLFNLSVIVYNIGASELPMFTKHGIIFPFLHLHVIIPCLLLNYISLVFHEFGHSAASERFNAKCGEIGFGFYLLTPVLYSDVTEVWRLKKHERVIVDLAGVYMQFLFMSIVSFFYLVTSNQLFAAAAFFMAVGALINLNPFLRFDGYWVLSDLTNTVNLRTRSNMLANQFYGWVIGINKQGRPKNRDEVLLTSYGVVSMFFIISFLVVMVFNNTDSIINFPLKVYEIVRMISIGNTITVEYLSSMLPSFILALAFYFLSIRFVFNFFKPKKNAA